MSTIRAGRDPGPDFCSDCWEAQIGIKLTRNSNSLNLILGAAVGWCVLSVFRAYTHALAVFSGETELFITSVQLITMEEYV